jgi:perosamine synthetase
VSEREDIIALCQPRLDGRERDYLLECLDTNWVSSAGPFVGRFEEAVARAAESRWAVAANSGTAALHLALVCAGVRPGDEVVMPALTFIAPANAVRYTGAWPAFVDAEDDYYQMDGDKLADFLESCRRGRDGLPVNPATGRPLKAIMVVHHLGHPTDMEAVGRLAQGHGLTVIEDASEALGARHEGRPVGGLGAMGCFSFNGNKLITSGGGGMLVCGDEGLAQRARHLSTTAKSDPVEFVHDTVGYNYRLTNLAAALGLAQIERLEEKLAAKRRIAARYGEGLAGLHGLRPMAQAPWAESSWWMYTVRIDRGRFGRDSREVLNRLGRLGIQTRPLWQPLNLSPAHAGSYAHKIEKAPLLHSQCLCLPCSAGLTAGEQDRVIEALSGLARA